MPKKPRHQKIFNRLITTLLTSLGIATASFAGVEQKTSVVTAKAVANTWQASSTAFAHIQADISENLQLSYRIRVTQSLATPGSSVNKGQTLLKFDAPQLQQDLAAYQASRRYLATVQAQLTHLRKLLRDKLARQSDLYTAQQSVVEAKIRRTQAWEILAARLSETGQAPKQSTVNRQLDSNSVSKTASLLGMIKAPFDGRIASRLPGAGVWVEANQTLLELENLARVYVTVAVPQSALAQWSTGETMLVNANHTFKLSPASQSAVLNPTTGLLELGFYARNPDVALQDGEWLQAMHLGKPQKVVFVPASAVVSRDGKSWCLVQQDNGEFKPVQVEAGDVQAGKIPVLRGLKPGQVVVTEGAYELLYRDINSLIQFVD